MHGCSPGNLNIEPNASTPERIDDQRGRSDDVGQRVSGTTAITLTGGTWSGTSQLKNNLTLAGNVTTERRHRRVQHGHADVLLWHDHARDDEPEHRSPRRLDTGGMTWNTVNYTGSSGHTLTLNSLFLATTLSMGSAPRSRRSEARSDSPSGL